MSATCWWSTGVDGMNAPTIAATCGAHIPAALTTSSVAIGPVVGQDGRDLAPGRQLEPGDADAGPDAHAERPGRIGHRVRRAVRVEVTVTGQVDRPVQRIGRDRRHERDAPRPPR